MRTAAEVSPVHLYLQLLKSTLTRSVFADSSAPLVPDESSPFLRRTVRRLILSALHDRGLELRRRVPFDPQRRALGLDWPAEAETMIGLRRLDNLQACIERVLGDDVPGDLIETGVWRGGASIFMRGVLKAYGDARRTVWCADSYRGLPEPNVGLFPADAKATWHQAAVLAVSLDEVKRNFERYGLLDERVRFLEGWFRDTLPGAPIERLSLLRLDGDMYESTMDALVALYDRVSVGGFVIVDDYGIPEDTCRRAVHDFRDARRIVAPILDIDGSGAYWRRET